MTDWTQFAQTRHGAQLCSFFHKLNVEIAEVTQNPAKPDAVLLLNTKKGYWLYKVFDREESVHSIEIYSDRYVQKLIDFSVLDQKLIYLVDDTLINGAGLFDTYELLTNAGIDEQYICPIVYALHENTDPKKKAAKETNEKKRNFWNSLQYYVKMTEKEIGDFCISVTDLLHSTGIPYVIDLPYLKDERRTESRTNFEVSLTKEQFQTLQENTTDWTFQWNSFQVREVNFLQGFLLHMEDEPLLSAVADCFVDFIVTGTYTEDEAGNKHIVFVPFAMAKTAPTERVRQIWELFADIIGIQPDYELPDANMDIETARRIWPKPYRECIYLFSMVIAERFKKQLKKLTGIPLFYDYGILKEHFPGNFAERAKALERKLNTEPDAVYQKLLQLADSAVADQKVNSFSKMNHSFENVPKKEHYNKEKAYTIILTAIQKQSTIVSQGKEYTLLEVDEMHKLLAENFAFADKNEERHALSQMIAAFLHSSVIGNRLRVSIDGKTIIKGFRYGENSDLALLFLNLGFYWAVVLMTDRKGKEGMRICYDRFIYDLREFFQNTGLLGSYITEENFEENNKYFKNVIQNGLHIYNKSFYFKPFYRGELPKSNIAVMYKIEDFVEKISY